MKKFLIVATAIFIATAAQAEDLAARASAQLPPLTPAYNWTGFYAGVNVGYGRNDADVSYTKNDLLFAGLFGMSGLGKPLLLPGDFNKSGVLGGGQIGYNWQASNHVVFGIEADFSASSIKESLLYATGGATPATIGVNQNVDWFGTVRARLGWLPTDRLFVYGTGGFAYGRVNEDVAFYGPKFSLVYGGYAVACAAGVPCFVGSMSGVRAGWTAGAGLEYALLGNLTLKAEYLYVDLSGDSFRVNAVTHGSYKPMSFNANFSGPSFHIVRAGLNYRF